MKPQNLLQLCGAVLLISVLLACNFVASITPTTISATTTLTSPSGKRIAFYATSGSYEDRKSDIYVVNADGSNLTHLAEHAAHPAWSSDALNIAFVSGGIYVMNADGTNQVHLVDFDVASNWAWSPDNRQIVFVSYSHGEEILSGLDVGEILRGKPGSDPKPLIPLGVAHIQSIAWSPDSQEIAFSYRRDLDSPYEIAVMNVEEALQSADWGPWLGLTEGETPAWSPTGKKIVFSRLQNNNFDIYVMEADGNNETRLTQGPADNWSPAWSPDGEQIAFFSKQGQDSQVGLYVMNVADALQGADGSNATRLTESQSYTNGLAWSPDGQQIAFISGKDSLSGSLYVINADGSHLLRLTDSSLPLWPQVPMWAPR